MNVNPYITKIKSSIVKRKYVNDSTHIVITKNIEIDRKKYNIEGEDITINGSAVNSNYESSIGRVYVIGTKPESDLVVMEADYEKRIQILKSLTSRYLIQSALKKYMNLSAINFSTSPKVSSFQINNIFFKNQAEDIKSILEKVINIYIGFALDVKDSDEGKVLIDGIYDGEFIAPHLSNISEIFNFKIDSYSFANNGIIFNYSN